MDAIQASIEHIKDGISGAQVINSDNIVLDLETIPVSYDTMDNLCQLLLGLRQRIQDQDNEINQLRDRMSGPKGNQPQEPVYHRPKGHTFI